MTSTDTADRWRHIELVLDRSRSMQRIKAQTEAGLRAFLDDQCGEPGRTTVSLYQFNDTGELLFANLDLNDVPTVTLQPSGNTALFDAIGDTIERARRHVRALPKKRRPDEIITVVLTDGEENMSQRHDSAMIRARITELRAKKRSWQFVLLGAGADVFAVAQELGIDEATAIRYDHDLSDAALTTASEMIRRGGQTGHYGFTDQDRTTTRH